jgi:hypothetical protein
MKTAGEILTSKTCYQHRWFIFYLLLMLIPVVSFAKNTKDLGNRRYVISADRAWFVPRSGQEAEGPIFARLILAGVHPDITWYEVGSKHPSGELKTKKFFEKIWPDVFGDCIPNAVINAYLYPEGLRRDGDTDGIIVTLGDPSAYQGGKRISFDSVAARHWSTDRELDSAKLLTGVRITVLPNTAKGERSLQSFVQVADEAWLTQDADGTSWLHLEDVYPWMWHLGHAPGRHALEYDIEPFVDGWESFFDADPASALLTFSPASKKRGRAQGSSVLPLTLGLPIYEFSDGGRLRLSCPVGLPQGGIEEGFLGGGATLLLDDSVIEDESVLLDAEFPAGEAAGYALQIIDSIQTMEYREEVLEKLDALLAGEQQIEDQLKLIEGMIEWNTFIENVNQQIDTIETLYGDPDATMLSEFQQWLQSAEDNPSNISPELADEILKDKDVPSALKTIGRNIIKSDDSTIGKPWLQLFIELQREKENQLVCELAYKYWRTKLLGIQVKGLALLAAAGKVRKCLIPSEDPCRFTVREFIDDWKKNHFPAQGDTCQRIMAETLTETDLWYGVKQANHPRNFTSKFHENTYVHTGWAMADSGMAVVGWDFVQVGNRLGVRIMQGMPDQYGVVKNWTYKNPEGGPPDSKVITINRHHPFMGRFPDWPLFDQSERRVPSGCVITGLRLNGRLFKENSYWGFYPHNVWLDVQYSKLNMNGTVSTSHQTLAPTYGDADKALEDDNQDNNLSKYGYFGPGNVNDNVYIGLYGREPTTGLIAPLTGARIQTNFGIGNQVVPQSKVSIHQYLVYHSRELTAFYPFDTAAGARDETGNGHDGTLKNGAHIGEDGERAGGVLWLDGNNQYVATDFQSTNENLTITGWILPAQDDSPGMIIDNGGGGAAFGEVQVYLDQGQLVAARWSGNQGEKVENPVHYEVWTHFAAVFTNNNIQLYVNGDLAGQRQSNYPNAESKNFHWCIGASRDGTNGWHFKGRISNIAIYDSVLTPDEIKAIAKEEVIHY